MLSKTGETKILDFGLARIGPWEGESAELTTVGQLMGTLDYMAPEQAERANAVDYRADLYSLGATLFRLLCDRAPLAASPDISLLAKLRLMAIAEPPSLDALRPDAPAELVALVSRMLSRDPADRPASAHHVAEELGRFTAGNELVKLSAKAIELKKDWPKAEAKSFDEAEIASQGANANNGRSNGKVWLALTLVPLLVLAAIWITLETQKGLLVIESDAEATVKLLKDEKDYQEFQVQPGPNSTRIYAGKYEVVLAEGSDSLKLTQEQISVTRGGTSIARLHWDKPTPAAGENSWGRSIGGQWQRRVIFSQANHRAGLSRQNTFDLSEHVVLRTQQRRTGRSSFCDQSVDDNREWCAGAKTTSQTFTKLQRESRSQAKGRLRFKR